MAASGRTTWQVVDAAELSWRFWDDQFIVFNPASGDTHLLNPLAGEALQRLQQGPADVPELARHAASNLGLAPDELLSQEIETLLDELDELGLVESVQS